MSTKFDRTFCVIFPLYTLLAKNLTKSSDGDAISVNRICLISLVYFNSIATVVSSSMLKASFLNRFNSSIKGSLISNKSISRNGLLSILFVASKSEKNL